MAARFEEPFRPRRPVDEDSDDLLEEKGGPPFRDASPAAFNMTDSDLAVSNRRQSYIAKHTFGGPDGDVYDLDGWAGDDRPSPRRSLQLQESSGSNLVWGDAGPGSSPKKRVQMVGVRMRGADDDSNLSLSSLNWPHKKGSGVTTTELHTSRVYVPELPSACILKGYLYRKIGRIRRQWYTNMFVIEDGALFVCWDLTTHFLIDIAIPLNNVVSCSPNAKDLTAFILLYTDVKNKKGATKSFKMEVRCATETERDNWVNTILRCREESRALSGNMVDRQKAMDVLRNTIDDLQKAAARAIAASATRIIESRNSAALRSAFKVLRAGGVPPSPPRPGILKSGTSTLNTDHGNGERTEDIIEREVKRRLSALQSLNPSQTVAVAAAQQMEGGLRLAYWLHAKKLRMKALGMWAFKQRVFDARAAAYEKALKLKAEAIKSQEATGSPPKTVPAKPALPPAPKPVDTVPETHMFLTNLWLQHAEAMARELVEYRRQRLSSTLQTIYTRRLRDTLDRMALASMTVQFTRNQKEELLLHLLHYQASQQLNQKRWIYTRWMQFSYRVRTREDALLGLLTPSRAKLQRCAIHRWYVNTMKMADRDLSAMVKLVSAVKSVELKHKSFALRTLDRWSADAEMQETMQLAQNMARANTKLVATFQQIPITRAMVAFSGIWSKIERSQVQTAFNNMMLNARRFRLVVRLCIVLDAIVKNVEQRISVRDPFNMLRAHACTESVAEARKMMDFARLRADQSIKQCSQRCALLCMSSLVATATDRAMRATLVTLRRHAMTRNLQKEKEDFLSYHEALLTVAQRSALERFAVHLAEWFERGRKQSLFEGWFPLYALRHRKQHEVEMMKQRATFRIITFIERRRVLLLSYAWDKYKNECLVIPNSDTVALHALTQTLTSARKAAADIELTKKLAPPEPDLSIPSPSRLLPSLDDDQSVSTPSSSDEHKRPPAKAGRVTIQEDADPLKRLRRELNLVSVKNPVGQPPIMSPSALFTRSTPLQSQHDRLRTSDGDTSHDSVAALIKMAEQFLDQSVSENRKPSPPERAEVPDWSDISEVLGELESCGLSSSFTDEGLDDYTLIKDYLIEEEGGASSSASTASVATAASRRKIAFVKSVGPPTRRRILRAKLKPPAVF